MSEALGGVRLAMKRRRAFGSMHVWPQNGSLETTEMYIAFGSVHVRQHGPANVELRRRRLVVRSSDFSLSSVAIN